MRALHRKRRMLVSLAGAIFIFLIVIGIALIMVRNQYGSTAVVSADFGRSIGAVSLDYGLNEEANWMDFASRPDIQSLHKAADSEYIRIWLDDPSHRPGTSTIPFENWRFDFTNLDRFVNAALKSGATPFMVFAYAPDEIGSGKGIGNADVPRNNWEFGRYCAEVVSHYKAMCDNGLMEAECDIDEWYWEVWNEPYMDYWWLDSAYVKMYNEAYTQIKAEAPNTKVGGYSYRYLTRDDEIRVREYLKNAAGMDFISIHTYSNYAISGANDEFCTANLNSPLIRGVYQQEMIGSNEMLFYDRMSALQKDIDRYYKGMGSPEIVISELGPNWNWKYEPYLDEPFVAAWYASALSWMIKGGVVDKEMYYSGTSNQLDGGFALWSVDQQGNLVLFPSFSMKQEFVKYNSPGSIVYGAQSSSKHLETLAVSNKNGTFITIINKHNSPASNVRIEIKNKGYKNLIDLRDGSDIGAGGIDLEPYEVAFIQIA